MRAPAPSTTSRPTLRTRKKASFQTNRGWMVDLHLQGQELQHHQQHQFPNSRQYRRFPSKPEELNLQQQRRQTLSGHCLQPRPNARLSLSLFQSHKQASQWEQIYHILGWSFMLPTPFQVWDGNKAVNFHLVEGEGEERHSWNHPVDILSTNIEQFCALKHNHPYNFFYGSFTKKAFDCWVQCSTSMVTWPNLEPWPCVERTEGGYNHTNVCYQEH